MASPAHPVLAEGAVHHVGDPVAFIVADTAKQARDAAELVAVDYDILPSATDLATAIEPGVPTVWPEVKNNIVFDWEIGDQVATEAAFAGAAHVTRLTVVNNRIVVASMEARAAIADFDRATGRWTLYANTQGGWLLKNLIGPLFNSDPENFRIVTPDVGGGFGMKLFLYAEHVLTCFAARALGRPVKWAADRAEAFLCDTQGRDNVTTGELAIDANGTFIALRTRNIYRTWVRTVHHLCAVYPDLCRAFSASCRASMVSRRSTPTSSACSPTLSRSTPIAVPAGPRPTTWSSGSSMPRREELNIDRIELRRRNMVPPSAMPHSTPVGKTYDSGDFQLVLDAALKKMDWSGFSSPPHGRRRSWQTSRSGSCVLPGGHRRAVPPSRAEIRFADDGFVDVYVGTQSTGQGHETAYVQLTANRLGIDGEKIRIRQGDTDTIPVGGGTGGARSLYSEGQAIVKTADSVIEKGKQAAAEALEAAVADITFVDGDFSIVGTDRSIPRHHHPRVRPAEESSFGTTGDHA